MEQSIVVPEAMERSLEQSGLRFVVCGTIRQSRGMDRVSQVLHSAIAYSATGGIAANNVIDRASAIDRPTDRRFHDSILI